MSQQNIVILTKTLTVDTSAYAAGDNVGGLLKFKDTDLTPNQKGILHAAVLTDAASQLASISMVVFDSKPGGTFTDNAAIDPADADLEKILGVINFSTYTSFNDNSVSTASNLSLPIKWTDGIYVALVTNEAPTYVAATDVDLRLSILQDAK